MAHPVVKEVEDHWYKICAILIHKFGLIEVSISTEEIEGYMASGLTNIVVHPTGNLLTLKIITDEQAKRLAEKEPQE